MKSLEGRPAFSPTAFGLFATSRTALVGCAESQRQAIVAVILYDQFRFVAGIAIDTHADWIGFSAATSLLCCLA